MADDTKTVEPKSGSQEILDAVTGMSAKLDGIEKRQGEIEKTLEEAKKPQVPEGAPNVRKTLEDPMTSRKYSLFRLAKALTARSCPKSSLYDPQNWHRWAEPELELSRELRKHKQFDSLDVAIPLGADVLPQEEYTYDDANGKTVTMEGVSADVRKRCRDMMVLDHEVDIDELRDLGLPLRKSVSIHKDMSANTATSGGLLVALATQGELIDILRAVELMSQVGAMQVDLPPNGSIRYPRFSTGVTIAATSEGASISESTPAFGALNLSAKPYVGLVDIPEELMKFATSANVEAWLRTEFARATGLKADADMINGAGGTSINGIVNYSGISSVTASTTGATGDTLEPNDPARLYADIADNNAPVDRGFFYALTNTLWAGLTTKRGDAVSASDEAGPFVFNVGFSLIGGRPVKSLQGERVFCSTQVPTNRAKGGATTLTLLLGGVGPEWVIGRAGVIDVSITDSDASKFANRLLTMRSVQYVDAGPRHEASFGMIDTLLNQ